MDHDIPPVDTPKMFAVQLGSILAFYVALFALISTTFGLIELLIPNTNTLYSDPAAGAEQVRFGIAALAVCVPTYLLLAYFTNRLRVGLERKYLRVIEWLVYLSLVIGSTVLLGGLINVLVTYLNGDLTVRFLLKATVLGLVVGGAIVYYLLDVRGYFIARHRVAQWLGALFLLATITFVVAGLWHIDSPHTAREKQVDAQVRSDLERIYGDVAQYARVNGTLPTSLSEVYPSGAVPQAPEGRQAYRYRVVNERTFELCGSFAHAYERQENRFLQPAPTPDAFIEPFSYSHPAGRFCTEATVNLEDEE